MNSCTYILIRSSLIMGVHPDCPVCSTVAASLVAVRIDMGETISATKVALVCGLWSVRVVALLSEGPSSCFCIHQLLFPCLEVLVQSASPHHAVGCKVLPGIGVDVKCFHVSLADILVVQLWVAFGSPSRCQLSIENVFWDAAIIHAVDMPQPTQPTLSEQGELARKVSSGQKIGVGHSVLPGYVKDTAHAAQVKGIESFLLSGICGPRLAAEIETETDRERERERERERGRRQTYRQTDRQTHRQTDRQIERQRQRERHTETETETEREKERERERERERE